MVAMPAGTCQRDLRRGVIAGGLTLVISSATLISALPGKAAQANTHDGDPIYRVKKSIVINSTCEKVWPYVENFSGIASWFKGFRSSRQIGGPKGAVGEIRELVRASNGMLVEEKLIYLDAKGMELGYTHIKNGPALNNVALVSLTPLSQNQCWVSWSNTFRPKVGQNAQTTTDFFALAYINVLNSLKTAVENP